MLDKKTEAMTEKPNSVAMFWRFVHMLSHVPLGFGEAKWMTDFHDWTAKKWEECI